MTLRREPPSVPALGTGDNLDLSDLGSQPLETFLNDPALKVGDWVSPHWRGCAADGEVIDIITSFKIMVIEPRGVPFSIRNENLQRLSGGYVFYSYQPGNIPRPDDESLRLFFTIDRPAEQAQTLAVAQLREAHDLVIDPLPISEDLTVAVPPYQAMSVGDTLIYDWVAYFAGSPQPPYSQSHQVSERDIGTVVGMTLPRSEVMPLFDGDHAELSYRIQYASGGDSESPVQQIDIVESGPPLSPLLPKPLIEGHDGSSDLDPRVMLDGFTLLIDDYPDLQLGDQLVVYLEGPDLSLRGIRADVSTVASRQLQVRVEASWFNDELIGKPLRLSYQVARLGAAWHSEVLEITVRRPLYLPWPLIDAAIPESGDEENQGTVTPERVRWGAQVRVPLAAETNDGEVWMHWEGHASTGNVIVKQADPADPRLFHIPAAAIPANLGKRLNVYYSLHLPDQAPYLSPAFDLKVADYITTRFPVIQGHGDELIDGKLSLAALKGGQAHFSLDAWPFMAPGQCLTISAAGAAEAGGDELRHVMRDAQPVSDEEYYLGTVQAELPAVFLRRLKLNSVLRVSVQVSFDDGESFKVFPHLEPQLVA
ncbi:hypothetical protein [Pseudomonas fulva]|uniref:hypothetical protein n=1 Tax=Pseudomonas fulva TaxID=47880 RepID=UPI0018A8C4D8|nr:hypothetical protein [Pseudomonas fulva]MBF8777298.1 hypothetical protein [Pseudomonas fulva]